MAAQLHWQLIKIPSVSDLMKSVSNWAIEESPLQVGPTVVGYHVVAYGSKSTSPNQPIGASASSEYLPWCIYAATKRK
jgi:hypothetical protein